MKEVSASVEHATIGPKPILILPDGTTAEGLDVDLSGSNDFPSKVGEPVIKKNYTTEFKIEKEMPWLLISTLVASTIFHIVIILFTSKKVQPGTGLNSGKRPAPQN